MSASRTRPIRAWSWAKGWGACSNTMFRGERNIQCEKSPASSWRRGTLRVICTCSTRPISPACTRCKRAAKAGWKTEFWFTPRGMPPSAASSASWQASSVERASGFSAKTPTPSRRSSPATATCRAGGTSTWATWTPSWATSSRLATALGTPWRWAAERARSRLESHTHTISTSGVSRRISKWKSAMKPAPTMATRVGPRRGLVPTASGEPEAAGVAGRACLVFSVMGSTGREVSMWVDMVDAREWGSMGRPPRSMDPDGRRAAAEGRARCPMGSLSAGRLRSPWIDRAGPRGGRAGGNRGPAGPPPGRAFPGPWTSARRGD